MCPKGICPGWTLTGWGNSTIVGIPQPRMGWHPLLRGTQGLLQGQHPTATGIPKA